MANQERESAIHQTADAYSGSYQEDLLEQYKLYVLSAENVSARRVTSNQYLLTLNAALIGLYGLQSASFGQGYWTLLIPAMGVLVSIVWFQVIKSHADLNSIKFKLIHEFERSLPAAMYQHEWQLAEEGQGKTYRAVTTIERWIPIFFGALHVVLAVMIALAIAGVVDWTK